MPAEHCYDEFRLPNGDMREEWKSVYQHFEAIGESGMRSASAETDRLVRESSANFRVSGDLPSTKRPWQLSITPLLIDSLEWQTLASGLKQRTRVLEAVLADLLGPQNLLRERVIPAELLAANPGYARVYHELPSVGKRLTLTATDLSRNDDGTWWVTGDRTRAPSGLGYALENRVITSRVFPMLIRKSNAVRLAKFFASLLTEMTSKARSDSDSSRVAILTPGPHSYRYVEDVYLARYLGHTLVQGRDLAVRDKRLHLKTLGGLLPIDVLWRHVSDRKCDPLELDPTSTSGVASLLQSIRHNQVAVANQIGSAIAQMPALMQFLPAAAKFLLGEELTLPSLATYWCGQARDLNYTLQHLDSLSIRSAFAVTAHLPVFPSELSAVRKAELVEKIKANPQGYVAQERPARSTTPVWSGDKLHSWYVALRSFQLHTDAGTEVLPGGLTRVSPEASALDKSPVSGRLGLDCWVVGKESVDQEITLLAPSTAELKLARGEAEMPSRVAENMFWLGRNAERAEATARILRSTLVLMSGENAVEKMPEVPRLAAALASLGQIEPDYAIFELESRLPSLESFLPESLFDEDMPRGLRACVMNMSEKAAAVHDRISLDAYRVVSRVGDHMERPAGQLIDAGVSINRLDDVITDLQAFSGLAQESMTRTHGWRFLQLGRRLERAYQTAELLMATLVNRIDDERSLLESVLQVTDSLMTYRSRYLLRMRSKQTIDLLINDESNPRSIVFQLRHIVELLDELPSERNEIGVGPDQKLASHLLHAVRMSDPEDLCRHNDRGTRTALNELLKQAIVGLPQISDALTARYLIHTSHTQQLTGRVGPMTVSGEEDEE